MFTGRLTVNTLHLYANSPLRAHRVDLEAARDHSVCEYLVVKYDALQEHVELVL